MWIEGRLIHGGYPVRIELINDCIGRIEATGNSTSIWIAPGWLDLQVNGYKEFDLNTPTISPKAVIGLIQTLWQEGITACCPTIITQSEDVICHCLRTIVYACEVDPMIAASIHSIHVEGPAISSEDGPRGAHPQEYIRPPDLKEYLRWQKAASGRIGIITLSPEYPESSEYIRTVSADGVIIALGHTAANRNQIHVAVDAGARLSTHLGNGSHDNIKRHPNYIWEQLAEDRLMASFICDNHHLGPAVLKSMLRAKGIERSILISDSAADGGLQPGIHQRSVGGKIEITFDRKLGLYGTPYLAGSANSLKEGIENIVLSGEVTLAQAIRMASTNPANLLGSSVKKRYGVICSGAIANFTLFQVEALTGNLVIEATIVHGQYVYQRTP